MDIVLVEEDGTPWVWAWLEWVWFEGVWLDGREEELRRGLKFGGFLSDVVDVTSLSLMTNKSSDSDCLLEED